MNLWNFEVGYIQSKSLPFLHFLSLPVAHFPWLPLKNTKQIYQTKYYFIFQKLKQKSIILKIKAILIFYASVKTLYIKKTLLYTVKRCDKLTCVISSNFLRSTESNILGSTLRLQISIAFKKDGNKQLNLKQKMAYVFFEERHWKKAI